MAYPPALSAADPAVVPGAVRGVHGLRAVPEGGPRVARARAAPARALPHAARARGAADHCLARKDLSSIPNEKRELWLIAVPSFVSRLKLFVAVWASKLYIVMFT